MRRRRFLRVVAGGGIAMSLPACASMVALPVPAPDGRIRIDPAEHAELGGPNGFLALRTREEGLRVYLLALEEGGWAALSPVCTHQGCTVGVEARYLVCPCHGSTYTRGGEVVRGPAPLPLHRFPVRVGPDGVLEIETEGP